jgi:hypothetical protein
LASIFRLESSTARFTQIGHKVELATYEEEGIAGTTDLRNPGHDTYIIDDRLTALYPNVGLEACGIKSHLRPGYASNLHFRPHYGSNGPKAGDRRH